MPAKQGKITRRKQTDTIVAEPRLESSPFTTELWDIDRPQDYPLNARNWPPSAITKVAQSIRSFGFRQPVVVDRHGVIIIGHLRRAAARTIPLSQIPVHVAADLTETQVRQLRLMDNRSHEEATWNQELLAKELGELKVLEALDFTGFDTRELDDLLGPLTGLTPPDELPAPISRLGDIWLLDRHRVACGDSTDRQTVEATLNGDGVILMVTDPPYGTETDLRWRDHINGRRDQTRHESTTTVRGDTRAEWSEAFELVPSLQAAYVWHASQYTSEVLAGLERIGFIYPTMIVWDKQVPTISRADSYWYQHEPCWYVRKKNAPWFGVPGDSTIWSFPSPNQVAREQNEDAINVHPTQKPVAILEKPIVNHLETGQIVYDPFLGSGSTLIAAHMHQRVCYGIEIEPRFVDLTVNRWEKFTGYAAILEATNQTFSEVSRERNG